MPITSHTATAEQITQIATDYYSAFPDVRQCAREWASALLKTSSTPELDPDKVFWQRFDNADRKSVV